MLLEQVLPDVCACRKETRLYGLRASDPLTPLYHVFFRSFGFMSQVHSSSDIPDDGHEKSCGCCCMVEACMSGLFGRRLSPSRSHQMFKTPLSKWPPHTRRHGCTLRMDQRESTIHQEHSYEA